MTHYVSTNPLERLKELDAKLNTGMISTGRYGFELGKLYHLIGARAVWEIENRLSVLEEDGR